MRTPACVAILILLRLHVFVRPFDFSVTKPPILSDIPNYLRGSEILCFIDNNKPFFCPKTSLGTPYIKPYAINPGRERNRHDQVSPDSVDPSVLRRPLLYSKPQKELLSSFRYQPAGEHHGSSNNSRPLDHKKLNYEVTTVKNPIIKPSSEYSILPSRSNVVGGSESTTEHILASVSKPDRGNKVHASLFDKFTNSLDRFERKFYKTTFNKLLSISPPSRFQNGISFAQSGLFLYLALMALSTEVDWVSSAEIDSSLQLTTSNLVKTDSGGAMRNTFEEDDFSEGACSILLSTMYVRARWRSPPTVLNGSRPFRDSEHIQPQRSVRMIRINDVMRYAALKEWNAEAIEIRYATPGLTLLLLVPEGHSLNSLATTMTTTSLRGIDDRLRTMRVAAILPIYTLRMTLLLPGKLQEMGISRLVETNNSKSSGCGQLRLSHAVQRIMFWAEAGRNAYKDDGIEWDEAPEKEIIVDRPYLFYVRWKNVTLMNGNFVL
ncbi:serpin B9-like isoform X2 [Maniola hyperantus]|uniref:serpin B9-like isoform X2 n=1 Tax=Aphantopus hyperantus TaxID=2795564 RepID=UPI0037481144